MAWTLFSWGVCFCFCISAPAQPPEQPKPAVDNTLEADILLGAARNAVKLGDIQTAIERFRMFHQRYPDREDGRREYADALFQAGRADEAVPEYERLIQLHPDDPKLYRTLIDALLNVGDHPRAKKWLIEAMPRFPDRVDFALSLALFYALDEETSDAEEIIAKYVRGRLITSRRMLLDAASLYVQLRRPADAAPTIERLLQSDPDNARVLALSVRYALLVGDYQAAVRQSEKFDRLYPGNVDLRLELASALYTSGNYAEAGRLFADVLDKSPRNTLALLGCARVALRDYDVDVADAFLDRVPAELRGRQWLLAVVERDTITGNYLQAEQMLDRLLQDNPDDRQASMALADLYRAENEFIKADTLYLAEGATTDDPLAGRHYALSLYLQRRYTAAEKMCCHVLAMNPEDTRAMMLLARILVQTNRCDEARDWCRKTQETDNDVFSECMFFSRFVSPEFGPCRADPSRPVYLAATLFDLAMEAGRRQWAKKTLDEALRADPNNVVLRTRLAEWCASFGLPAQAACAAEIYSDLLARDPSNQKWMLGLARANVTMRCYDQALALYGRLRCESPGNYLYARETARVVFFVCGSPQGLAEYDAALCGWPGLREEARRLSKERWAKANHYSSPSIAACNYEALLALEPYEPHLAFELGQVRGMLGTTTDAIDAYAHLLAVNPNHRDAQIAIVGKELERCRELQYDHCFARERGRDGLTSIDRLGEYIRYQFPREDENEYLSIGYGRLSLAPTYGSGTTGNALAVRYQKQVHGDFGRLFSPVCSHGGVCRLRRGAIQSVRVDAPRVRGRSKTPRLERSGMHGFRHHE